MNTHLSLELVRATEAAAMAAARWVGRGNRNAADQAACEGMRQVLNDTDFCGTIVIGEGERDEAPMLFIGEKLGRGDGTAVHIAVDPLEGTNLCANGLANAISVLAACLPESGHLMHAPDCYMEKLVVGAECRNVVDITAPPSANVKCMAMALGKDVDEMIVGVLDRPRHHALIQELRDVGCRVHLVHDGDITLALAALDPEAGLDALMGIGGAPEGVITAAAVQCWGGEMQGRLVFTTPEMRERAERMVEGDVTRVFHTGDLASGTVMVTATGITSGDVVEGVKYHRGYAKTASFVMDASSRTVRRIETVHWE